VPPHRGGLAQCDVLVVSTLNLRSGERRGTKRANPKWRRP
jgi:hypothetical protein